MLKDNKVLYSYNDIMIEPNGISSINSRSECVPFDKNGKLPIFTAPMSTVIDENNFDLFQSNNIYAILPRNVNYQTRINFINQGKWVALSLNEFKELFVDKKTKFTRTPKVLIDIANGHMKLMYDYVARAKSNYENDIEIMVGNIANPETYHYCVKAGVDYVRVGIGGGSGCITSSNTAIHYPMASLINDIYLIKDKYYFNRKGLPKIIADGGIRNYSDIIKALALGADYVMVGSLFCSLIESTGKIFYKNDNNEYFEVDTSKKILSYDNLYKLFYGMASKNGQYDINGAKTKTSEGISKYIKVTSNIETWVENMKDYLKSAMSYTNVKTITDFNPKNITTIIISKNTQESINK